MNAMRKTAPDVTRNRLMGAVHAAAKKNGIVDDTYRDMLRRVTGKESCRDMTNREIGAVLDHLNSGRRARRVDELPQARKIRALWLSGYQLGVVHDRSDRALRAFVRRQTGVDSESWLRDPRDARKVIEALKSWLAREAEVDWQGHEGDPDAHRWCVMDAQIRRLRYGFAVTVDLDAVGKATTGKPGRFAWDSKDWDSVIAALGALIRGHSGVVGAE